MDETNETSETNEFPEINFGKEIAKVFAISTASTAGGLAGFLVIGLAIGKYAEFKQSREAKKAAKLESTEN